MEKVVDLFGVGEANSQKLLEGGNDLSEIQQGLFIGSVAEAANKDLLKSSNVTHILTVAVALAPPYPHDFVYKVIEVVDRSETDLAVYFEECFSFMDQAIQSGGGVLVHCFMGISRSVTIVVAYLMKKHGIGFSKAMDVVKSRRPQALPNFGFISQLKQFEKSIKGRVRSKAKITENLGILKVTPRNFYSRASNNDDPKAEMPVSIRKKRLSL